MYLQFLVIILTLCQSINTLLFEFVYLKKVMQSIIEIKTVFSLGEPHSHVLQFLSLLHLNNKISANYMFNGFKYAIKVVSKNHLVESMTC